MSKLTYICDWCGKEFSVKSKSRRIYKHKFCSLSCSVSHKNHMTKKDSIVTCDNCGKEFNKLPHNIKRTNHNFCSKDCQYEYTRNINHPNYVGGYNHDYGSGWKLIRKMVIKRDKICKNCGKKGDDVHHIIPYHVHNDNSLENLMLLCKSCHSKIGHIYYKNQNQYFDKIREIL